MNETICKCGQPFPVLPAGHCGGTGYAVIDGQRFCYGCADKAQIEDLRDRSGPTVGYLKGDKVTTWTGGELMKVTWSRGCELTRQSNWHDQRSFRSVHAVDAHGGHWTGRGSDGVAIKMRPVKG